MQSYSSWTPLLMHLTLAFSLNSSSMGCSTVRIVSLADDKVCDGHWWSWSGLSACPVMISSDKTTRVAPSQSEAKKDIVSSCQSWPQGMMRHESRPPPVSSAVRPFHPLRTVVLTFNPRCTHQTRKHTSTRPWCTAHGNSVCLRCCRIWHYGLISIYALTFLITVKRGLICISFLNMHDGM